MEILPQINFTSLGITTDQIKHIETLRHRPGHMVYRIVCQNASYVLKWFEPPAIATEVQVYDLLANCGVPTLPLYAHTNHALLLEDLEYSSTWRLARGADLENLATGVAIAEWYSNLHQSGRETLKDPKTKPAFLHAWVDEVNEYTLCAAGTSLDIQEEPVWSLALEHTQSLKAAYLKLPQTFNYNDFAFENLAITRQSPLRAVVFDYDQFCTGTPYSDWRNVVYSLLSPALEAFQQAYGPVSKMERLLDEPLSVIYSLIVASRRSGVPGWAKPLLEMVNNGELEHRMRRAMDIL